MARQLIGMIGVALVAMPGCQNESNFSGQERTDVWGQAENDEVDLLFVVDNSFSMAEEQAALAAGFTSFIAEIETAGVDFHLGVISTSQETDDPERGRMIGSPRFLTNDDDYVTEFANRVTVGVNGSDKEKGLLAVSLALSEELLAGVHFDFLREDANLLVVFVSDEEDCSDNGRLDGFDADACYTEPDLLVSPTDYINQLRQTKRGREELISVAAVIGPNGPSACENTWPGFRYVELVQEFGGKLGSICETDWSAMLYDIGLNAAGISTDFLMSEAAVPDTIKVRVDGEIIPEDSLDGWRYDAGEWEIEFRGRYVPPRGTEIACTYEIAPSNGPPPE